MSTNYNKGIIIALTVIVIIGAQISGTDGLGLSAVTVKWVTMLAGTAGALLAALTGNKWQPTIPPGHALVPLADVKTTRNAVAVRLEPDAN